MRVKGGFVYLFLKLKAKEARELLFLLTILSMDNNNITNVIDNQV